MQRLSNIHLCVSAKKRSQTSCSSPPSSPLASSGFSDHCYERDWEIEEKKKKKINKKASYLLVYIPYVCNVYTERLRQRPEGDGGVVAVGTRENRV